MAIFRKIDINFWQDELVAEMTPEDKYFYIYLMTNGKTSQCGIYRINRRVMAFDLGWNMEKVDRMISRFEEYGRIKYNRDEQEIFMVNWLKYNSAASPKIAKRVDNELSEVKTIEFRNEVVRLCILYGYPINTVSIQVQTKEEPVSIPNPHQNHYQNQNKNQNHYQNQKQYPEQEEKKDGGVGVASSDESDKFQQDIDKRKEASEFYQQNFGVLAPAVAQEMDTWIDTLSSDLVIEAMKIALRAGKQFNYALGILKKWYQRNIRTLDQAKAESKQFARSQQRDGPSEQHQEVVPEWMHKQKQDKPREDPKEVKRRAEYLDEYLKSI
ncbi:DnaD domain-containing protein [Sporolactobacillus terrae]|uniref:DnaD domain-containing protein n=1 Tax=Sporolactobacillus terrae TaxID=269673 RepID=UPI0004916893|nr:DnaD domain protein [Sporolactobacillus terrae]